MSTQKPPLALSERFKAPGVSSIYPQSCKGENIVSERENKYTEGWRGEDKPFRLLP